MTKLSYAWDAFLVALIIGGWFALCTVLIGALRAAGFDLDGWQGTAVILTALGAVLGAALRMVRVRAYDEGFDRGRDGEADEAPF